MKDYFLEKYEVEYRQQHDEEPPRPTVCVLLSYKIQALWKALKSNLLIKFFLFQILSGIVQPSFEDFEYYFAIDTLKIKPEFLSLQFIWNGIAILIVPFIFIGSFKDSEYRFLIMLQ